MPVNQRANISRISIEICHSGLEAPFHINRLSVDSRGSTMPISGKSTTLLHRTLVPGIAPEMVTHLRLLRTMNTVAGHAEELENVLAGLLRPLLDQELSTRVRQKATPPVRTCSG